MKNIILVFFIATTISFLSCIDSANLDRDQNELPSDSAGRFHFFYIYYIFVQTIKETIHRKSFAMG